jgi:hypothetical protein
MQMRVRAMGNVIRRARPAGTIVLGAICAAGLLFAACGSGDDVKSIQDEASATAHAKNPQPAATAPGNTSAASITPGAAGSPGTTGDSGNYAASAKATANKLIAASDKLQKDMMSAGNSKNDPKWPAILNEGADAIMATAKELKALKAPDQFANVARRLNAAADQLNDAADLVKQSVAKDDDSLGTRGYFALNSGKSALRSAVGQLP